VLRRGLPCRRGACSPRPSRARSRTSSRPNRAAAR
jgi:hypothetical protein